MCNDRTNYKNHGNGGHEETDTFGFIPYMNEGRIQGFLTFTPGFVSK